MTRLSVAARLLGVPRSTLWLRIQTAGIPTYKDGYLRVVDLAAIQHLKVRQPRKDKKRS
jgi:hypothetical protein